MIEWTDEQIDHLVQIELALPLAYDLQVIGLMRNMRDAVTAEFHNTRRLLADCEDNRGQLVAALQEVTAERDQFAARVAELAAELLETQQAAAKAILERDEATVRIINSLRPKAEGV